MDDATHDMVSDEASAMLVGELAHSPIEAVRLPQPFAALNIMGHWSTFCVCQMSGASGKRGGWRIGRFRTAPASRSVAPRFNDADAFAKRRFPSKPDPPNLFDPDVAAEFAHRVTEAISSVEDAGQHRIDLQPLHEHMVGFHNFIDDLRGQFSLLSYNKNGTTPTMCFICCGVFLCVIVCPAPAN